MAYPTPTIYTYRVQETKQTGGAANGSNAYYRPEFSTNSGTSWTPVSPVPYQSLQEAFQKIGKIVNNEAQFQKQFLQVKKFENPKIVPVVTIYAYPPV